jgi:hypothetical protein
VAALVNLSDAVTGTHPAAGAGAARAAAAHARRAGGRDTLANLARAQAISDLLATPDDFRPGQLAPPRSGPNVTSCWLGQGQSA